MAIAMGTISADDASSEPPLTASPRRLTPPFLSSESLCVQNPAARFASLAAIRARDANAASQSSRLARQWLLTSKA